MLSASRRAAGGADAALHRHLACDHHPDLARLVSRALRPRRSRHGHPQALVAAGRVRCDGRQRYRALCAGAPVQDRVRDRGVGGGLFANLLMTFYGRPIHQAVATSSALAVLISIPGAIGYVYAGWPAAARFPDVTALQAPFALGYVSLIGAVLAMPTTLITAPLGVRAAHAMSKRSLEIAFGCYLFIVGGRFVISLL